MSGPWGVGDSMRSDGKRFSIPGGDCVTGSGGVALDPYSYKQRVDDLAGRLKKIERKLGALMF